MRLYNILIELMAAVVLCVGSASAQAHDSMKRNRPAPPAYSHTKTSLPANTSLPGDSQVQSCVAAKCQAVMGPADDQRLSLERTVNESLQKAIQEAREREMLQPHRLLAGNGPQRDGGPGSFDDGIYLRQVDGANICAAIVSYNFSSGGNPQLESITTCTPANAVRSIRARGAKKLPQGLRVVRAAFQKSRKK